MTLPDRCLAAVNRRTHPPKLDSASHAGLADLEPNHHSSPGYGCQRKSRLVWTIPDLHGVVRRACGVLVSDSFQRQSPFDGGMAGDIVEFVGIYFFVNQRAML